MLIPQRTVNTVKFQLWQPESHPIEIRTAKLAHQKLEYKHHNSVEPAFVDNDVDWKYSSAVDYNGDKGLIELNCLEPMIITIGETLCVCRTDTPRSIAELHICASGNHTRADTL